MIDGCRYGNKNLIQVKTQGQLKHFPDEEYGYDVVVQQGAYTFVVNGTRYTVDWVADEDGFRPVLKQGKASDETFEADDLYDPSLFSIPGHPIGIVKT